MSRRLQILALIAIPGLLAACDSPSVLSKAKPGECYAVVGRDASGAKLAKTACAGSPAALAAANCPAPTTPAAAACPAPGVTEAVRGAGHKKQVSVQSGGHRQVVRQKTVYRRAAQGRSEHRVRYQARDTRVARSGEVTSLGIEYARVDQELAGGPSYAGHGQRYERREYERHDDGYAPPPPPRVDHRRYRSEGGASYAEGRGSAYAERQGERRGYRAESYSSSSASSSSSYSSSSSSRRGGYGAVHCDCDGPGRGAAAPTPYDERGFLTWRGKTPG